MLLTILVLLSNIPHLFVHYVDWDEADFMAESWAISQGQVLYRDIAQIHPVLNFWVMVPFFHLFRPEWVPLAIRTMNTLLVLLGAVLVGRLIFAWLANQRLAFLGAFLFVFYCAAMAAPSPSPYGEFYAMFPILLSAQTLYFIDRPRPWMQYLTGILWGVAFFFKQTAIFDAMGLFVGYLYLTRSSWARKAATTGWMAAGFISVAAAIAAYFLAHGALLDAWRWMFVRPLFYANSAQTSRWPDLLKLGEQTVFRFALPLVAAILGLRALSDRRNSTGTDRPTDASFFVAVVIWFGFALAGLCTLGRFYPHYLFQLVPAASLLPLFILSRTTVGAQRAVMVSATITIFALATTAFASEMLLLSRVRWVPRPVQQSTAVADYIDQHTTRRDRIFLYGVDNLDIFFLSHRLSNNGVYMFPAMTIENMHDPAEQQRLRDAFLARLPTIIVTSTRAALDETVRRPPQHDDGMLSTAEFFQEVLKEHYDLATTADGLRIYALTPPRDAIGSP